MLDHDASVAFAAPSADHVPDFVNEILPSFLTDSPRKLHPALSYDAYGSQLFEQLCKQPEYYLTRTETNLLYRESSTIIEAVNPEQIVDLGCGNCEKTQILIHEAIRKNRRLKFVPCDIDQHVIERSIPHLSHFYSESMTTHPIVGSYEECLDKLRGRNARRLFMFLGGTFANMFEDEQIALLGGLSAAMGGGDHLLLAADLVKSPETLEAAYNDSAGCIRASMLQMLAVLNRDYGANFTIENYEHMCCYNSADRTISSFLRAKMSEDVEIPALDLKLNIDAGEYIEAERRQRFVLHELLARLAAYGLAPARVMVDEDMPYALTLLRKDPVLAGHL